ncbi:hypothetical protein MYX84_10390 [Acidobacteria bacterium AH-259-O06]|nr:hypothetical protein [Acidobacteria bacterium AH-259-O06]
MNTVLEKTSVPLFFRTLRANGVFSAATGVMMALAADPVANLIGFNEAGVVRLLGVGLVGFAVRLFQITHRGWVQSAEALMIISGDFLWVIGSVFLLVFESGLFSQTGMVLISIVAVVVLVFGELQAMALYKGRAKTSA